MQHGSWETCKTACIWRWKPKASAPEAVVSNGYREVFSCFLRWLAYLGNSANGEQKAPDSIERIYKFGYNPFPLRSQGAS